MQEFGSLQLPRDFGELVSSKVPYVLNCKKKKKLALIADEAGQQHGQKFANLLPSSGLNEQQRLALGSAVIAKLIRGNGERSKNGSYYFIELPRDYIRQVVKGLGNSAHKTSFKDIFENETFIGYRATKWNYSTGTLTEKGKSENNHGNRIAFHCESAAIWSDLIDIFIQARNVVEQTFIDERPKVLHLNKQVERQALLNACKKGYWNDVIRWLQDSVRSYHTCPAGMARHKSQLISRECKQIIFDGKLNLDVKSAYFSKVVVWYPERTTWLRRFMSLTLNSIKHLPLNSVLNLNASCLSDVNVAMSERSEAEYCICGLSDSSHETVELTSKKFNISKSLIKIILLTKLMGGGDNLHELNKQLKHQGPTSSSGSAKQLKADLFRALAPGLLEIASVLELQEPSGITVTNCLGHSVVSEGPSHALSHKLLGATAQAVSQVIDPANDLSHEIDGVCKEVCDYKNLWENKLKDVWLNTNMRFEHKDFVTGERKATAI